MRKNVLFYCVVWLTLSDFTIVFGVNTTINGATKVTTEEIAYQISIRIKSSEKQQFGSSHLCGGSLISPKIVLTAARCLHVYEKRTRQSMVSSIDGASTIRIPADLLLIVMGSKKLSDEKYSFSTGIKDYEIHPDFSGISNDIAILRLVEDAPSCKRISPIKIGDSYPIESVCLLTGWGNAESHATASQVLLKADMRTIPREACEKDHPGVIKDGMVCAVNANGEADICNGDAGGPLVFNDSLIAMLAWMQSCGDEKKPSVFTDVVYYKGWILGNARKLRMSSCSKSLHSDIMIAFFVSFYMFVYIYAV